jgi:hypothetical protein
LGVIERYLDLESNNSNDLSINLLDGESKTASEIPLSEFNDNNLASDLKSISNV